MLFLLSNFLPILAQGTIEFRTRSTTPFVNVQVTDGRTGMPLAGDTWTAQLYYSENLSATASLRPAVPATHFFSTGLIGYVEPKVVTLSDIIPGTVVALEMRVWNTLAGDSFETAASRPNGVVGQSTRLTLTTGNVPVPDLPGQVSVPASLVGLPSFSVNPVPEPSSLALVFVGGLLLILVPPSQFQARAATQRLSKPRRACDDDSATCGSDMDIFIHRATSAGSWNWDTRSQVNSTSTKTQFMPRVAVDNLTSTVAVSWYDCRNSSINTMPNTYAAVSRDGFSSIATNFQLNPSTSIANTSYATSFWDYAFVMFYKGWVYSFWQDNSNSTGNNPNGTNMQFDVYVARFPY